MTKTQPATKKDIKGLEKDIKGLEKAIEGNRKAIEGNRKAIISNSQDIKSLEKEILALRWEVDKKLDTYQQGIEKMITNFKDEIINHIDGAMKELQTAREKRIVIGHQLTEHEGKLENHEKRITHLEAV